MILIILPKNNPLDSIKPKPVVSAMFPYTVYSQFVEDIRIFSPLTDNPNNQVNFKLFPKANYNKLCIDEIQKLLDNNTLIPIVEVHQDVRLAGLIAKKFPQIKVSVIKHGDYFINRFKESLAIMRLFYYRKYIRYLHSTYCISDYVLNSLLSGYPKIKNKIFTVYNTYGHILEEVEKKSEIVKKNQIIFVGKPVPHKGIVEFISALPEVLKQHKDYTAIIVGAFFSKKEKYAKTIEELMESSQIKELISSGRIVLFKNLTPTDVFSKMLESKIAVVPTKTKEPFGLVCLEAHLAKCAVVSSKNGGLPEVSGDYALYLKSVLLEEIVSSIDYLIKNANVLSDLSRNGYEYAYNKFAPKNLVPILDSKRIEIINEY
ncbi:MAG: glycosyltransferase family 4 protein [Alphaproteobacteria bacterium]|jgi:glycosyltransferase involved in cell wall biosynthesis|nr:glycosyltransferase family 4 protein [Alphaproteobacteria bacterium]